MNSLLPIEQSTLGAVAYVSLMFMALIAASKAALLFDPVKAAISPKSNRYGSIDGLRGVLAGGVFVHHGYTAYQYFLTGKWGWSLSPILNQMGQTTVAMFFMITGFLFALKAAEVNIDWRKFYIARAARLCPLYFLVVLVVFLVVLTLDRWQLRVSILELAIQLLRWLTFVVTWRPEINTHPDSWTIIAGVNWSLKYEIYFYVVAVPLLHIISRYFPAPKRLVITIAVALLSVVCVSHFDLPKKSIHILHFLGGIAAAYAIQVPKVSALLRTRYFHGVAFCVLIYLFTFLDSGEPLPVLLTVIVFASVANGGGLLGILNTAPVRWLGDVSYGIYLLHGMVLWLALYTLVSVEWLPSMNIVQLLIGNVLLAFVVVFVASLSYLYIERPAMNFARRYR